MPQEELAERSTISVSVIRKLERGERDSACLPTLRKFAGALGVTTMQLFAPSLTFAGPVDEDERNDLYELRRVLQPLRGVDGAALLSLADDESGPDGDDLTESLRIADRLFRDDDFAAAAVLPTLITHARWTLAESTEDQRRSAWAPLAQTYLLAAALLTQLCKDDLAYHTLGLALDAGARAQDNGLVGSAVGGETAVSLQNAELGATLQVGMAQCGLVGQVEWG